MPKSDLEVSMRPASSYLLIACIPFSAALAQTPDDFFAAQALASTPTGALTPLMSSAMIQRPLDGAQLAIRYAQRTDGGTNTFGVAGSVLFVVGLKSSVSLTAGVRHASCTTCSPALMLGAGGDMRVYEGGDVVGTGSGLALALSGNVGYGHATSGDNGAWTLAVGSPITLSLASGGKESMHIVPFFTPVFGVGRLEGAGCSLLNPCDNSPSGTRIVLGGGIGIWNPMTSLSASVGVNQVMRTGENPVFGINVIFGGR